jgi:alpha-tubulin suppressor-like RCC1 family protein
MNDHGQLGRDAKSISFSPTPDFVVGLDQVVSLAAGWGHACALRQNGSVWCWGSNDSGQVGDGTTKDRYLPVAVIFPFSGSIPKIGIVRITAGVDHSCAIDETNSLYCWGGNSLGEAGLGQQVLSATAPTLISFANNVVSVHSGPSAAHTCAVLADGSMKCWGWNGQGQLGNGLTNTVVWDPTSAPQVQLPQSVTVPYSTSTNPAGVTSVSMSQYHTCISTDGGDVYCWGINYRGMVLANGNVTRGTYRTPQRVTTSSNGIENITQVSVTPEQTCARRANGTLYCWGGSYGGSPVARETDVVSISSGGAFECLFRRDLAGVVKWCVLFR